MRKKWTLAALLCTAAVAGPTAGAAYAGEITGNGKPTAGPKHANSICVFSGKNDDPGASIGRRGPHALRQHRGHGRVDCGALRGSRDDLDRKRNLTAGRRLSH